MGFATRHCVQFSGMAFSQKHAITPVELCVSQRQPASRQLSNPIGGSTAANPLDYRTNLTTSARRFVINHPLPLLRLQIPLRLGLVMNSGVLLFACVCLGDHPGSCIPTCTSFIRAWLSRSAT